MDRAGHTLLRPACARIPDDVDIVIRTAFLNRYLGKSFGYLSVHDPRRLQERFRTIYQGRTLLHADTEY